MIGTTWQGRVAVLTLDRPEKRNALTVALCTALRGAVADALSGGARALVLTGRGTSFCAGADLDDVHTPDFRAALRAMLDAVVAAPVPVVAAVNGPAIGAGTQLAVAADLRVGAPDARFAVPTARIGLAVDPWTIRRVAHLAGSGTARALLLGAAELDLDRAVAAGLVDRRGGPADAVAWAVTMTDLAPLTVAYSKQVLNDIGEPDPDGVRAARAEAAFEACWASQDVAEGRRARAERRAPVFRGR
ncbi:MAG TPA: enoyl-CoA hydratase [Pseudonocardia sp.]|nr:enoyl-CoA hydratase [Pseudonocardia sp.]